MPDDDRLADGYPVREACNKLLPELQRTRRTNSDPELIHQVARDIAARTLSLTKPHRHTR